MVISLNNETRLLSYEITIEQLIIQFNIQSKHFAVEVNQYIIPRSEHSTFVIKDGDKVEIVTAIGGG
jgi:sulfur carrier protein